MKRTLLISFATACLLGVHASDLVVSNNAIISQYGDSWNVDSDASTTNIAGWREPEYFFSYLVLKNPATNISFYNFGRSGGTMDDTLTNRLQKLGLPTWGFQSNNFQHIGIACMTDNADLTSNQNYLVLSNIFQAPTSMSDGGPALNAESGWASTATVQWIGLGEPPHEGAGPDTPQADRNDSTTNAGWQLGLIGVDVWNVLTNSWFADYTATGGTNVQWFDSSKPGHFASGGALSWALAVIKGISTDTNISTCTLDWNSTTPVSTNHCVISSISKSGNVLTFNRLDDRLPMAWDVPDGTITNDARGAFNLIPSDVNAQKFTLQISNLPSGHYSVVIDGQLAAASISKTELANGWNMFTNYAGPYWAQRKEVLGRIRDVDYVNRVTLIPGSAGDAMGLQSLGSFLSGYWSSGDRGDQLIADVKTNVAILTTNSTHSFAAVHAAAQPTNHTFTLTLITPVFAPFHR